MPLTAILTACVGCWPCMPFFELSACLQTGTASLLFVVPSWCLVTCRARPQAAAHGVPCRRSRAACTHSLARPLSRVHSKRPLSWLRSCLQVRRAAESRQRHKHAHTHQRSHGDAKERSQRGPCEHNPNFQWLMHFFEPHVVMRAMPEAVCVCLCGCVCACLGRYGRTSACTCWASVRTQ